MAGTAFRRRLNTFFPSGVLPKRTGVEDSASGVLRILPVGFESCEAGRSAGVLSC